ncbi:hypothetical protein ESZ48_09920 [Gelidibacter gilvus]|uniref:Mg chelatase-related protein C-terminal domain-containing protein n=1 Tax=Gelidibacter gilvus TaxID=59602 RepID=A0A4Q0XGD8_9FLAO|nr:hypothetical protein ESZ48_09920 [Gelidibacter gilvus]
MPAKAGISCLKDNFNSIKKNRLPIIKTLNLNLWDRSNIRILKVSRTIADLEGVDHLKGGHISEAIQNRFLDKEGWLG